MIQIRHIQYAACRVYHCAFNDLIAHDRRGEFIEPRYLAIHLAVEHLNPSFQAVARAFNREGYKTIANALDRIGDRLEREPLLRERAEIILSVAHKFARQEAAEMAV